MEKAYIILAHKNPVQLLKLIKRLDDSKSTFFIHIDKRVPLEIFKAVIEYGKHIKLVERVSASWGSINLVRATLNALELVKKTKRFERIILLSGQDYPVKSNDTINSFYGSSQHRIFIEHFPMPNFQKWAPNGGIYRLNKYFLGLKGYQRFTAKSLNFLAIMIPFLRRRSPVSIKPFAGSQWWTIDEIALDYILNFIRQNPAYLRFHKFSFAPDELFFQTILLNCNDEKIATSILNDNLVRTIWENASSSHPKILDKSDIHELHTSDCLFARKFEQETDSEVFEALDALTE